MINQILLLDSFPDVTCIRCVPFIWCCPAKKSPVKVWDDTGAGGGKPGSIWIINSFQMIAVSPSHDPPKEQFYDFNSSRFFMDEKVVKLLNATAAASKPI
jgi:hypothetical protein